MHPLEYLSELEHFGIKLGLDNIRAICAALGDPHRAYRSVVVAGTNGKGSVTAMVDTALRAAGYRVGRYTSPHLLSIEERFVIDGVPVPTTALHEVVSTLRDTVDRLRATGVLSTHPTFFEVTTAAAFELFRRASVDVAVLEVGLGGRFDATNVVTPVAGAITSIDLDHEQYLGATIREIAREKAGIIKAGMLVVTSEQQPDALEVIESACQERGARLVQAREDTVATVEVAGDRLRLRLATPHRRYGPLVLALRGRHQVGNAVVAVRLLEELEGVGLPVSADAIAAGVTQVVWRGRLEVLRLGGRHLLLDAAHNPAGAAALATYLREVHPGGLPLVFGVMRDKDAVGMLTALAPCATAIICTAPRMSRAMPATELADKARRVAAVPIDVEPDPRAALERAWTNQPFACVAGSIFLVGEIVAAVEGYAPVTAEATGR